MSEARKAQSEARLLALLPSAALHSAATGLHCAKLIDRTTFHEYDVLGIESMPGGDAMTNSPQFSVKAAMDSTAP